MDGNTLKAIAMGSVVACYLVYSVSCPGIDGYVFGTMMAVIGLLAGLKLGEMGGAKLSPMSA